jgi:L-asparaginase
MSSSRRPQVLLLALGGTIATESADGGPGQIAKSGENLLSIVPEAGDIADVVAESIRTVPSASLTIDDAIEVAHRIDEAASEGIDGIVVTQGTDTIEEMAFAIDLLTSVDGPVVLTGAMRGPESPGSDARANLLGAIAVAASPDARRLGTLVYFNDEIHAARQVRKRHTSLPSAFESPSAGPVGYVTERRVRIVNRPVGRAVLTLPQSVRPARVAIVTIGFDDDGALLRAAASSGCDGIVVSAMGGGHVPGRLAELVGATADRVPLVLASHIDSGEVLTSTYGYPGSEVDLIARGAIAAGALSYRQAAVLLRLLLMAGVDRDRIGRAFEQASHPQGRVELGRLGAS